MTTPAIDSYSVSPATFTRTTWYNGPDNPPDVYHGVQGEARQESELRPESVPVPKVNGFRACAPFFHNGVIRQCRGGIIDYTSFGVRTVFSENIVGWGVMQRSRHVSANTRNAALVKAYNNLKAQNINSSVFMGEAREGIELVANRLHGIAASIIRFRKSHLKLFLKAGATQRYNLPREFWCDIPNLWLELQYGWKPAMGDIYGIINELARDAKTNPPVITARGSHKDSFVENAPLQSLGAALQPTLRVKYQERVHAYLFFNMSAEQHVLDSSRLGLLEPASLTWELLPYSFIVDWALPIGNWLSALTATAGFNYLGGGMSKKVSGPLEATWIPPESGGYYNLHQFIPPNVQIRKDLHFERECFEGGPPVPGLYVKNPLSPLHVANAIALLTSAFTRDPHWSIK